MLRSLPRAALAALLTCVAGPALADGSATLQVRVRVVDRCEVRVPDRFWPDRDWGRLPERARDAIHQRCSGHPPGHVDVGHDRPPHGDHDHDPGHDHGDHDPRHADNGHDPQHGDGDHDHDPPRGGDHDAGQGQGDHDPRHADDDRDHDGGRDAHGSDEGRGRDARHADDGRDRDAPPDGGRDAGLAHADRDTPGVRREAQGADGRRVLVTITY